MMQGYDKYDAQNSPAKRLVNEEFDLDSDDEDYSKTCIW